MPLVWGTMPNLLALQFGNVQAVVLVLAILGMVAFEKDRGPRSAGPCCPSPSWPRFSRPSWCSTCLARRQWKALAATAAWGAAFSLLVVVFGGLEPWLEFVTYQLPRLSNGEAFADLFVQVPISALINLSYSSLPFKLDALGLIKAPQVSEGRARRQRDGRPGGHRSRLFDRQRPSAKPPPTAAGASCWCSAGFRWSTFRPSRPPCRRATR